MTVMMVVEWGWYISMAVMEIGGIKMNISTNKNTQNGY